MEEQSHRTVGGSGFLGISLGLRILEAMTFGVLRSRSSCVYSIRPMRVSNYFRIGSSHGRTLNKKCNATHLVLQMLLEGKATPFGNTVTASDELLDYYRHQKKKDDLSDTLLQALALLDWSQMSREL